MPKDNTLFTFDVDSFVPTVGEDGSLTITLDPGAYEASRPEEVTVRVEREVDAFRQTFITSMIEQAGPMVADAMAKDVNIQQATITCEPSNAFKASIVVQRARNGLNPKTREALITYGSASVHVTTAYKKTGQIKRACQTMSDRIRDAVTAG